MISLEEANLLYGIECMFLLVLDFLIDGNLNYQIPCVELLCRVRFADGIIRYSEFPMACWRFCVVHSDVQANASAAVLS